MPNLIVDGMFSGTGIRNADAGGYLDPEEVGLSPELAKKIQNWLAEYEAAHYRQFNDEAENERLDREGIEIARQARQQLVECKIEYFSEARMKKLAFE